MRIAGGLDMLQTSAALRFPKPSITRLLQQGDTWVATYICKRLLLFATMTNYARVGHQKGNQSHSCFIARSGER